MLYKYCNFKKGRIFPAQWMAYSESPFSQLFQMSYGMSLGAAEGFQRPVKRQQSGKIGFLYLLQQLNMVPAWNFVYTNFLSGAM